MDLAIKIWILLDIFIIMPSIHWAIMPPPWADPDLNPCANRPGGWQLLFWPPDGQCYKIFQIGYPCPDGMELTPARSKIGKELYAECRCPPKQALSLTDGKCYQLFTKGSCSEGFYFGPDRIHKNNITTSNQQLGSCKIIPKCASSNSIHWINDGKCYQKLTKGPCSKGQLLTVDENKIPLCTCNKQKEMRMFHAGNNRCYQHFTKGPCREMGHLFLPDQSCGCYSALPHYHWNTKKCFELGTIGPCSKGEMFTILPQTSLGGCVCKQGYIRHQNNTSCHRPFTRGPCKPDHILVNSTSCLLQPCVRGELFFPQHSKCYKIGSWGPCDVGKILSFDFETRPSIDGLSYNGVCICQHPNCEIREDDIECDRSKGLLKHGNKCFKIYSQGPCAKGAWLAPQREGKEPGTDKKDAICECMPGTVERVEKKDNSVIIECLSQAPLIAELFNKNYTQSH
ncbi:hypothetical protein HUJ04_010288 [Dendroctonus ponderosae]|uniref:DUF4789 domain-containing protein n=2 Tax=Dendroctonus ponderosae TaxID=77166 RepID=A0AAR5P8H4_DENPD|nr:hypothetical protein HUJ04_010288 [Dendroctonus ponderosae]